MRGKNNKSQILPHFQIQHSVVVTPSSVETKLKAGTQL